MLLTHSQIADAGAVGQPNDEAAERPVSYVVLAVGASVENEAVQAFVHDRLARHEAPAQVHFVTGIPKSSSGKILRRLLRETA